MWKLYGQLPRYLLSNMVRNLNKSSPSVMHVDLDPCLGFGSLTGSSHKTPTQFYRKILSKPFQNCINLDINQCTIEEAARASFIKNSYTTQILSPYIIIRTFGLFSCPDAPLLSGSYIRDEKKSIGYFWHIGWNQPCFLPWTGPHNPPGWDPNSYGPHRLGHGCWAFYSGPLGTVAAGVGMLLLRGPGKGRGSTRRWAARALSCQPRQFPHWDPCMSLRPKNANFALMTERGRGRGTGTWARERERERCAHTTLILMEMYKPITPVPILALLSSFLRYLFVFQHHVLSFSSKDSSHVFEFCHQIRRNYKY